MRNTPDLNSNKGESTPTVCYICKQGNLQAGKRLFITTDSILLCVHCGAEYHREQDKYVLKKPSADFGNWKKYEGTSLSEEELSRISQGGLSNAEIVQQEEERKREEARQDKERRLRETPGTPQYYFAQAKRIVGISENENQLRYNISWSSTAEAKSHIKKFTQIQRELRQLKKDVNFKVKEIRSSFKEQKSVVESSSWSFMTGFKTQNEMAHERAMKREQLRRQEVMEIEPYQIVVKMVDSMLIELDRFKVDIDGKITKPADSDANPLIVEDVVQPKVAEKESTKENTKRDSAELLNELNSLIGLEAVKQEVSELVDFIKVQKLRESRGMPVAPLSLHVVFYGNPGTGKTSVARLLSQIYQSLGLLSKGHLVETDRSGLVAGYVGQTALKVQALVGKALGGTLFIDEAYALAEGDAIDYGKEAIETLLKQMEDHRNDLVVIVAGYPEKMEAFLSSNPGLRSRFNRFWKFEDYSSDELTAIYRRFCIQGHFALTEQAKEKVGGIFEQAFQKRDSSFGNARYAGNLFEASISNQASRIVRLGNVTDQVLATIEPDDIPDTLDF